MKKIFYIIPTVLLALSACTLEKEQAVSAVNYPDGMVCVNVDVMYPDLTVDTRAMAQVPTINNLYVAVFGSEGSFQNFIPAVFDALVNYQDHTTTAKYKVYLPITDKKRHLHFIANPPKDENDNVIMPAFGDEDEVINAMIKTKGSDARTTNPEPEDAYWQKVEMDHIGAVNQAPGTDGYFTPDQYTVQKLAKVCLVRNYAKILVTVGANEPYELVDYQLFNVPATGSVAPWNTGTRQYEPEYMDILRYADEGHADPTKKGVFYSNLSRSYLGYMPNANDINRELSNPVVDLTGNKPNTGAYMYERTMFTRVSPENSQSCFIARIRFTQDVPIADDQTIGAGEEFYYKIAIVGKTGDYIPILRNIQYSIIITGIKEKGKETAQDAADGDFAGDVSTGLAISSLNELSNGTSTIRVNQTEYTSAGLKQDIDGDGTLDKVPDYTIYWQFYPNSGTATGTPVTQIGTTDLYDVSLSMYDITSESAIACSLDDLTLDEITLTDGKWGTITVPIAERGTTTKTSVIRISGRAGTGQRIYREVIINVIPETYFLDKGPQSAVAVTDKGTYIEANAADGLGKEVKVHFRIPADLGASMFPLNVTIEAKKNNLYSTVQNPPIPVSVGTSYWKEDQSTYYFIRQIPLSEYRTIVNGKYEYKQDYVCSLFTSKDENNSTDIVLRDEKGYFMPCVLSLKTVSLSVDKEVQTVSRVSTSATINVTSGMNWSIDWASSELTDVSPDEFTFTGTDPVTTEVTFTFPVNEDYTQKEYIVDLVGTYDGLSITKTIKIIQKRKIPAVVFNVSDFSSLGQNTNYNTTHSATVPKDNISVRITNSLRSGNNYVQCGYETNWGQNTGMIEITPLNSVTITGITVTYNNSISYYQNPSSTPTGYSVSGTTGTWTGTSNNAVTLSMGYQRTGSFWDYDYTFPRITSISVTYEE